MAFKRHFIVIEKNSLARDKLKRVFTRFTDIVPGKAHYFRNLANGLEEIKRLVNSGTGVELIVSDVYFNEEINIFRLAREMEKIPGLWNTPLLVFTNHTDMKMYNQIQKDISHFPFRLVAKNATADELRKILFELNEYKRENQHFLDLEVKVLSFNRAQDLDLVPTILRIITKYGSEHPKSCTLERLTFLAGRLYFDAWRSLAKKTEVLIDKMQNFSEMDESFGQLKKEIKEVEAQVKVYRDECEKNLLDSFHIDPNNWKTLSVLHNFYMEEGNAKKGKKYLTELIKNFPDQVEFSFKMGKIYELEGNLSNAIQFYMDSFHNALEEGVINFDAEDVMEVIDASLNTTKKLLKKMGISQIYSKEENFDVAQNVIVSVLRKNNAQIRSALYDLARQQPKNANHLNKIGITYRRAGDYSMAIEMYSKALALAPKNHRIRTNYAVAMALCESWDLAGKEAKEARLLNKDPSDNRTIDAIIRIISDKDREGLKKILV